MSREPASGLIAWLRRLFGGGESTTSVVRNESSSTAARRSVASRTDAARAEGAAAGDRDSGDAPPLGAGVEAYARFAGIEWVTTEVGGRGGISPSLEEEILQHISQHKPGPNSFPSLSTRILNLLSRPDDVDISDLVRMVSQDPGLSAAVLRAANSAALRGVGEIQSIRDAVTRLGLRDVTQMAGAMASRSLFSAEARAEFAFQRKRWNDLFLDATVIGMGAARLAMETNRGRSDRAFLGGLLHDVGKSIVLKSVAAMLARGETEETPSDVAIDALVESLHVTVGSEAQRNWGLPAYLVTLCERHHDDSVPDEPDLEEVHLVRVVSGMRRLSVGQPATPDLIATMNDSLEVLRINAFQFRAFHTELKGMAARMGSVLAA